MAHVNIVRAWKDEEYRRSLTETEKALLPANPAGFVELAEEEMNHVEGGFDTGSNCSQFGESVCYLN